MFLQENIINVVANVKYISIINAAIFFYQFRVKTTDCYKLTMMLHRDQKYFSIASMSFKNSFVYVQRRINIILRDIKNFCRAFIDDIIIFFNILNQYLKHFSRIFQRLLDHDIKLKSCKAFLNFSSIILLNKHVDEFDLYAVKNKIVVILSWKFSSTLKVLKIYLEFIE
jgi:hypothetical protein